MNAVKLKSVEMYKAIALDFFTEGVLAYRISELQDQQVLAELELPDRVGDFKAFWDDERVCVLRLDDERDPQVLTRCSGELLGVAWVIECRFTQGCTDLLMWEKPAADALLAVLERGLADG